MSKVTETVTALAAPVAEKLGLELWDVEYIREAGQWFLRVYIDKDGGVSINDCAAPGASSSAPATLRALWAAARRCGSISR